MDDPVLDDRAFREGAAQHWKAIVRVDPVSTFPGLYGLLARRVGGDALPQPGLMGSDYRPNGVVLLGMNPGHEQRDARRVQDARLYKAIEELRDSNEAETISAFESLNATQLEVMPTWRPLFNEIVGPLLNCAGLSLRDVAYTNMVKWRVEGRGTAELIYLESWRVHTRAQLEWLRPHVIVSLGKTLGHWINSLKMESPILGMARLAIIPRGDSQSHTQLNLAIEQACEVIRSANRQVGPRTDR